MSLKDCSLKNEYRSFRDNIVSDFYVPVLKEAILYQRAVGFFSSSALSLMADGIAGLVKNNGKIEIIASPRLSQEDINEIKKGYSLREIIEKSITRSFDDCISEEEKTKLSYIADLIAHNILDIKIAYLSDLNNNQFAMYHEKVGIITDKDNNSIAFSGSMNESENAFYSNYESFDVFCSWTNDNDKERVLRKKLSFDAIWNDYEPGITTIQFPDAAKKKLYSYNSNLKSSNRINESSPKYDSSSIHLPDYLEIRDYQKQAIETWEKHHFCGIFDMATGTGKTLTALAAVEHLYHVNNDRLGVIVLCPYQHLVEQWVEDIKGFGFSTIIGYSNSPQRNWKTRLKTTIINFMYETENQFCFVTTNATFSTKYVQSLIRELDNDVVLVVDEAHNIGSANYRKILPEKIKYRLALSATIDRYHDESGTNALYNYFGEKCIEYSLKQAIEEHMLTRYYYHPVVVSLNDEELDEYLEITKQLGKYIKKQNGKTFVSEAGKRLLIKRSRIIAGASEKLQALKREITPHVNDNHILIYCGSTVSKEEDADEGRKQIEVVAAMLGNELGMKVGRFTALESSEERMQIRESFSNGNVMQALVAIKCLDEGVNIPAIKSAYFLASSTNPKEYIQRRGRVLRKYEGKKYAEIVDFVTLPFPIEMINYQNEDIKQSTRGLIIRELKRIVDFAELSENYSESSSIVLKLQSEFNISNSELIEEGEDNVI